MKRVILCPNPYRDGELTVAKHSKEILEAIGFETVVCLPFSREGYDDQLGVHIRWRCTVCRCWASIWGAWALCPSWSPTSWNGSTR